MDEHGRYPYTVRLVMAEKENEAFRHFLALPAALYPKGRLCQNRQEEEQLLLGAHALSGYFKLRAFVCYAGARAVGRCAVALYPEDKTAYVGFFESVGSSQVAGSLFKAAEQAARQGGCTTLVGPVNASFWVGYRMKASHFKNKPYFGEPYNLPYYPKLWRQSGFTVRDKYVSNLYGRVPRQQTEDKYTARLRQFTRMGYTIRSPKPAQFTQLIGQVHGMIMELYADFPVFKTISRADFEKHYAALRYILAYPLTKIAYKNGQPVGFFISLPNYGNRLYTPGPLALPEILLKKLHCRNYVMLYMGVLPQHRGLGKAIAQTVIGQVRRQRVTAIGALIHLGKETEKYAGHVLKGRCEYLLFEKKL